MVLVCNSDVIYKATAAKSRRVRREDPRGILVLTYNRHAAAEMRIRLRHLIGDDAAAATISTCHALAMPQRSQPGSKVIFCHCPRSAMTPHRTVKILTFATSKLSAEHKLWHNYFPNISVKVHPELFLTVGLAPDCAKIIGMDFVYTAQQALAVKTASADAIAPKPATPPFKIQSNVIDHGPPKTPPQLRGR